MTWASGRGCAGVRGSDSGWLAPPLEKFGVVFSSGAGARVATDDGGSRWRGGVGVVGM